MSEQAPEPKKPWYKDPFVIAFVVGISVLTVMPVMQGRFLTAPPPLSQLPAWTAKAADGGILSSQTLAGTVLLVTLAQAPCESACVEAQTLFGRAVDHVDDLKGSVQLLTISLPGEVDAVTALAAGRPGWHVATQDTDALAGGLRAGWEAFAHTDAGSTLAEFARVGAIALVDQQGQVRGFWRGDTAGRGNAINAARLLARHGPTP